MRKTLILLGVVLAVLAVGQIATASTYYDIVQGLKDNTPGSTAWNGTLATQPAINGWTYVIGPTIYPWGGTHGATFVWNTNLTDSSFQLANLEYAGGGADWAYGWEYATAPVGQEPGVICNGTATGAKQFNSAMGASVAFRNGWNSSYFYNMEAVWTAPIAGTASVTYTVVSDAGTGTYCEFQLGLYRQGVFNSKLGWAYVTNSGTNSISASGLALAAGDSIVLLAHAPDYNVYGTHQQNGGASGGITLVQNPGTIIGTVTALGGGPVAGVTITVGSNTATTASDGTYSIAVDQGTWTVSASKTGFVTGQVNNVAVTSGNTTSGVNFNLTPWGTLTGTVSGPMGPVAGAVVKDGSSTYTATTGTNGVYSISIPAGSYSMTASKSGFNPATLTVSMTNNATTTQNFTLTSSIISGIVSDSIPPNAPIAGVNVWTADGMSSTVSDSAGHYSLPVTSGTYVVGYEKSGYASQSIVTAAPGNVTQNVSMAQGWDLAAQFAAANPNGAWSYWAENTGTDSSVTVQMPGQGALPGGLMNYWTANGQINNRFMLVKSLLFTGATACDAGWGWIWTSNWHEGRKVIGSPGITWTGMMGTERNVARFTAPVGGNYKVTARFAGATPTGTTNGVALRKSGAYLLGNPTTAPIAISGFAGRAANLYTDSTGATPVVTYSQTMDLVKGDTVDALLYGMNTGWSQVDLTIAKTSTIIMGRVTSDLPGNPPVIGATVVASAGGNPYQTTTDTNGNYVLSVAEGDYEISVVKANYDNGSGIASIVADQVITKNFTLHHQGKWDVSKDFTFLANPNGQWSYGDLNPVSGYVFTPYDTPTVFNNPAAGTNQPITEWSKTFTETSTSGQHQVTGGHVGQNLAATPFIWTAWNADPRFWYIEPQNQPVFLDGAWMVIDGDYAYSRKHLAAVRWTAPDSRIINIHGRFIKSGKNYDQQASIVKNGGVLMNKVVSGFVGTNAAGYTDSVGPGPVQSFQIVLPVSTGDTFDFVQDLNWQSGYGPSAWGYNGFPESNIGVEISIDPGSGVACNTIKDIKARAIGDTVYLMNPVTITAQVGTYLDWSFYASSADRSQSIKLIGDANTNLIASGWTTKFSGTVVADPADPSRKAVQVLGLYDFAQGTAIPPLGMTGKGFNATNAPTVRDRWVRVWGKVTSIVTNTGSDSARYAYESITINDGGGDIKILTHVQSKSMAADPNDPNQDVKNFAHISVGDYLMVVGIVGTSTGTDNALMPTQLIDFQQNYTYPWFQ